MKGFTLVINIFNQSNKIALDYFCGDGYFGGSVALTGLLLKMDADVDIPENQWAPLYAACLHDKVECAET
ncbi:hypothetical protein CEXT_431591 [Caerostris extrusa]|uniref:Uncharacterized protein n=1 Tax=Caerostris extrusa TaxID=172846 RepID=A0AAV4NBA0_CAEEX|nr:hypothetical protein CEXT_431591 [Caerostris extrusa]